MSTASTAPDPIFNCPQCSHYLSAGSLACPDCHAIIYTQHIARIAREAQSLDQQQRWPEARELWHSSLNWFPPGDEQAKIVRDHIAAIDAQIKTGADQKTRWIKRLGPLAPIALFLIKFKSAFLLLFKLKFLLSMLGFFALYWALWGWKFALGFTLSIFIHEMGHYITARHRGLKADLPIFLPGFGAYVRWYHQGISLSTLARIALAGPLYGLGAAVLCALLYFPTHQTVFLGLAEVGALVNLFNLTAVLGLDGAQAVFTLSILQRGLIVAACLVVVALTQQYVFLIIAGGMAWRLFTRDAPAEPDTSAFVYFLLLLFALGALRQFIPPSALS